MTIAVVQTTTFNNGFSGAFAANVTPGNTILMAASGHSSGNADLAHTPLYNGATVTGAALIASDIRGTTDAYSSLWLLPNVSGVSKNISITVDNADIAPYVGGIALEVSGLGTSPTVEVSTHANGSTAGSASTGSIGPLVASPQIIFASMVQDNALPTQPASPWNNLTMPGGNTNSLAGWQIVTSGGSSYNYTVTGSSANWAASIMAVNAGATSVSGTGATTIKKYYVSGIGNAPVVGTGATKLKKMSLTGAGVGSTSVTGATSLKKMVTAAVGNAPLIGTSAAHLKKMVATGVGNAPIIGTAITRLKKTASTGIGTVTGQINGVSATSLKKMFTRGLYLRSIYAKSRVSATNGITTRASTGVSTRIRVTSKNQSNSKVEGM